MARAMKDSGIEWIGEIPEGWEVSRLKYLGNLSANGVDKKIQDGEALYKSVHYMDVYRNSMKEIGDSEDYLVISATDVKASCCALEKGDVLFTNSSETPADMGHSTVVRENLNSTLFGYHLMRFRPKKKVHISYQKYMYGFHYMRKWFEFRSTGMTRYGISNRDFSDSLIIIPPIVEQQAIADYLDRKCSLIDSSIEKQKSVIEKMKLYKQSLITEAVTKGLDSTVKMKPSGIEWIGEIPEDWEVRKLGTVASVQTGPFGSQLHNEDYVDEGTPIITVEHFGEMSIIHNNLPRVSDKDVVRLNKYTLRIGDLVFSQVGSVDRSVRVSEAENGWLFSGRCLRVRFDDCIVSQYINYCFCKSSFKQHMGLMAVGCTMPSINTTILSNIRIALPSISEQQQIADYLDKKCCEIDNLITQKLQLLTELESYKKSLIYECVTGKREVV